MEDKDAAAMGFAARYIIMSCFFAEIRQGSVNPKAISATFEREM